MGINTNSGSFKAGEGAVDVAMELVTGPIPAGSAMRALRNGDKISDLFRRFRRGGSGGCNSFAAGTLVVMADGSTKPIEEVQVGEEVLATDPETGEEGPREVLATIVGSGAKTLVEITVDTTTQVELAGLEQGALDEVGGRPGPMVLGDVVIATDEHPFWSPELDAWVDAIDLLPGMWLLSSEGTLVQVTGVQAWVQPATVHNLTVQGIHTYYVTVGSLDVLSHNSGGNCSMNGPAETVNDLEVAASKPQKPSQADQAWSDFLGPRPYTDIHPRTGQVDPNRLVSSDGHRSIRMGDHEMNSKPAKFHYHKEIWDWNSVTNTWFVHNIMQRVPLGVKL